MTHPSDDDSVIKSSSSVRITVRELYQMVYIDKLSDADIARRMGLSAKTVRNYRRKCSFDSNFKTGRMDLPLTEVKTMLYKKYSYDDIAQELNSTKTAVRAFCTRHNLSSKDIDCWPISRRQMVDLILLEFTVSEISIRFGVRECEVINLIQHYGLTPFNGQKTHEAIVNRHTVKDNHSLNDFTISEKAPIYFGSRLKYCRRAGYFLDNNPISAVELAREVIRFEESCDEKALIDLLNRRLDNV